MTTLVETNTDNYTSFIHNYLPNKKQIRKFVDNATDLFKTQVEYTVLKTGALSRKLGVAAGEFLELSLMPQDEREFTIKNSGGQVLTPQETQKMFEEMGIHKNRYIQMENMNLQTFILSDKSKIAKELNNNEMVQEAVKKWQELNLSSKAVGTFNSADSGNKDIYLALGQAKIIGLHKTDDGYIEGYVEDVYDFDEQYGKAKKEDPSIISQISAYITDKANSMAVDLQNKGILKNYRTLIPIRIKAE